MQELEKILEEMKESSIMVATSKEHYIHPQDGRFVEEVVLLDDVEKIIRNHMNDGWIPVEERLPEVDEDAEETIEDDDCPEYIVTIRGASESTTLKYSPYGTWFDENGYVYDVIAWRPLPEPYKPKQPETCKYTGGSCCWPVDQCSDCPNNPERSENDQ